MKIENLNTLIIHSLEESKGLDIVTLDVKPLTDLADTLIICTGTSNRHVSALANNVIEAVKAKKYSVRRREGQETGEWVVIDLGDTLVHVMQEGARRLYQLEELWTRE
jgi:ribosome-associated protein